jgi:hypothetical protein
MEKERVVSVTKLVPPVIPKVNKIDEQVQETRNGKIQIEILLPREKISVLFA